MAKLNEEKADVAMAFRVTQTEKLEFMTFCKKYHFTFSQMVRKAIRYYMKKVEAMDKDDLMFL